jgi:hypothetical protein
MAPRRNPMGRVNFGRQFDFPASGRNREHSGFCHLDLNPGGIDALEELTSLPSHSLGMKPPEP